MNRILLLFFVILVSCKSSLEDKLDTKNLNLEKLKRALDSLFNSKIGENEPGVAVLVAYNQKKNICNKYKSLPGLEVIFLKLFFIKTSKNKKKLLN